MRISAAVVWTLWSFFAHQIVDGITVRPGEISMTTTKPRMKSSHKSNKTAGGEMQITSDTRIRRLIPYMSYYHPINEYNYVPEYHQMHPGIVLRKKPSPQIPNIAYLYGGSKYSQRPAVQAGFIYKARPDPYKTYMPLQPQTQPSYNTYKYQPLNSPFQPSIALKPIVTSGKSSFSPFSAVNKLPGEFVPIFKSKNLPYKYYDEKVTSNDDVSRFTPQAHHEHMMEPFDDDEFIPMHPSPPPAHYHNSQPISNHLYHSKIISTPEQHQNQHAKHITYSNPTPIYITSTETTPIATTDHPNDPSPVYTYQDIVEQPTTPPHEYHTVKVTTFSPDDSYLQHIKASSQKVLHSNPDLESVPEILTKLQKSNHLPATLTPDNVDNSIKTLVKILNNIKQKEVVQKPPPKYNNHANDDYDYTNEYGYDDDDTVKDGSPGPNSGRPGIDYPNFHIIPETKFSCKDQRYKGFFGDTETSCQVWHYCDLNGGKASFLCPNGTIFSQVALTCDWWFNVKCANTPQLYVLNERLYKYILPFTPKFPEDYSGPLVDKYLAIKFQEMEEKLKKEKEEAEAEKLRPVETDAEEDNENENEVEVIPSESEDKPRAVESSPDSEDIIAYTPGPVRVPTIEIESTSANPLTSVIPLASELPPVPVPVVEQERLEMIEIKSDGTSGHLTHNLQ